MELDAAKSPVFLISRCSSIYARTAEIYFYYLMTLSQFKRAVVNYNVGNIPVNWRKG